LFSRDGYHQLFFARFSIKCISFGRRTKDVAIKSSLFGDLIYNMEMIGMHVNALRKLMRDIGCAEKLIGSNQSYIGLLDEAYLHLEEILEQNEFTKLTLNG
jgi:hypothetical protein